MIHNPHVRARKPKVRSQRIHNPHVAVRTGKCGRPNYAHPYWRMPWRAADHGHYNHVGHFGRIVGGCG